MSYNFTARHTPAPLRRPADILVFTSPPLTVHANLHDPGTANQPVSMNDPNPALGPVKGEVMQKKQC